MVLIGEEDESPRLVQQQLFDAPERKRREGGREGGKEGRREGVSGGFKIEAESIHDGRGLEGRES